MRNIKQIFVTIFLAILFSETSFGQFGQKADIVKLELYKSFDKVHPGTQIKIAVKADVADSWHINSNKPKEDYLIGTEVETGSDQFKVIKTVFPEAHDLKLGFSEKPVSVFQGEVLIGLLVQIPDTLKPGEYKIPVKFTYQACNNQSCMPPCTLSNDVDITVVDNQTQISETNAEIFSQLGLDYQTVAEKKEDQGSIASALESSGIILSLLIVFLGGLALNLTPCVYPLIPMTVGYFGGQSEGKTSRLVLLGILYVLGMALTYSIIGVVTALSGAVFGTLLQNSFVIISIALVLLALSLSMFGVYEFKLPDSWVAKAGGAKGGAFGAFFMGLTMGVVAAPCIGPFVLGLVTFVAAKGDPYYGFLMFFVMAVGLGTPYLILAIFSGKIKKLPRAGDWMDAVKHIFGFLLVGMAIYFLTPILPKSFNSYLLPGFMILAALWLILFDKLANNIKGFRIFKIALSVVIIAVSVYALIPSQRVEPDWIKFNDTEYIQSLHQNKKIIIDFYADWCIPCKELDASTFTDPKVLNASSEYSMFKVDMTKTLSEQTETLRKRFNIVGMPTVIFINSKGEEVERLTGFVDADQFLSLMNKVN